MEQTKAQWIEDTYAVLCREGHPQTKVEHRNLRGWAEAYANRLGYFAEGLTPQEACDAYTDRMLAERRSYE